MMREHLVEYLMVSDLLFGSLEKHLDHRSEQGYDLLSHMAIVNWGDQDSAVKAYHLVYSRRVR